MTHDTPPKRIWVDPGAMEVVQKKHDPSYDVSYTLTSEAEAMVAAALRGAADLADTTFSGSGTDAAMVIRHAILASIPQPASAALDKLIAEAVNEAMLQCIGIVANLRNKRNPGPLFEVLNRAMSDIEDARFAAIREKNNG